MAKSIKKHQAIITAAISEFKQKGFQNTSMATDAYAEAWAFCYFLIRTHPDEFAEYLKILQQKNPLGDDSPQDRIDDFRAAFDCLPQAMNADMIKHLRRLK